MPANVENLILGSNMPAWHGAGTVLPDDAFDWETIKRYVPELGSSKPSTDSAATAARACQPASSHRPATASTQELDMRLRDFGSIEAAKMLGISPQRVRQLAAARRLRGRKGPRGAWLFQYPDILRFRAMERPTGRPPLAGTGPSGGDKAPLAGTRQ